MATFFGPSLGALGGTQSFSTMPGGTAGHSLTSGLLVGGVPNHLSSLFDGGSQQTNALLGDIKDMLSELLQQDGHCGRKGGDHGHGCGDEMKGGRGDDHLYGGCGDDEMKGGRGDDHLYGGCGHDVMKGGRGDDHLYGGCGDDEMKGGRGDDHLYGGCGHNHMDGGRGSDTYVIEPGSDAVITDGRGGNDIVTFQGDRDDYIMERRGDDLIVTSKEDGTRVVIKDQYAGKGGVDKLQFADGEFDDFDSVGSDCCGDHKHHVDHPDIQPIHVDHGDGADGGGCGQV